MRALMPADAGGCRERNDGCYTALTYLSAKVFEETLVALVTSIIFACIVFFPCEFSGSFALFWLTYFQTTLIGIREPPTPAPSASWLPVPNYPLCMRTCDRAVVVCREVVAVYSVLFPVHPLSCL